MCRGVITWLSLLQLFKVFFSLLNQRWRHLVQRDDTVILQSQDDAVGTLANIFHVLVQLRAKNSKYSDS